MTMIYLVQGNCGEYSDYREWVVCAYHDEAKAQEHARLAKEWRQQHPQDRYGEAPKKANPFDPDEYYGTDPDTDWTAYGVEIRASVPSGRHPMKTAHRDEVEEKR